MPSPPCSLDLTARCTSVAIAKATIEVAEVAEAWLPAEARSDVRKVGATSLYNEGGIPRCRYCKGDTHMDSFALDRGKGRLWVKCKLPQTPHCQKRQTLSSSADYRVLGSAASSSGPMRRSSSNGCASCSAGASSLPWPR